MESRYQSIFFENMWKYVTRRIRDTCERSANRNHFDRCSTTIVNNGAANDHDEHNSSPPCKWLAFRQNSSSYQNDNGSNNKKWSFEHLDRNWTDAKPWENDLHKKIDYNDEKNAGPPWKWFAFRKFCTSYQNHNEENGKKWNLEHFDKTNVDTKPWEKFINKQNNNDEKSAGPPSKWVSFHIHSTSYQNDNGENTEKWSLERFDRTKTIKPWEKFTNGQNHMDNKNAGPPCKWLSLRKRCRGYQNDNEENGEKWCFKEFDKTKMNNKPWERFADEQNHIDEKNAGPPSKWLLFRKRCAAYQNEIEANGENWSFDHFDRTKMNIKPWENVSNEQSNNDEQNAGPPCKWLSFRKCRKSYQNDYGANGNKWNFKHLDRTWMDAITWSGAAVLGWYTSQIIHFKLKHHCRLLEKKNPSVNNLFSSILPYITHMNKNDYYVNSVSKIEKLVSDFTPTVYLMSNGQDESVKDSGKDSRSACSTSTDTSENELGEVLNSIENRLGLAAIEHGQYQDGLSLLRSAAHRNHAPAIYNLGLCYEKGLGVTANEKTAMELYKSAAALDHPEALYNLGIYYGQGRGGLKADQETAIRLLRLAAVQGQQAAIDALKYLDVSISEPRHNDRTTWSYNLPRFPSSENIVPTQSRLFIDNINYLQARV